MDATVRALGAGRQETGHELGAYWVAGYAGGLFVPFADATSGAESYGGGRYALDTAKGNPCAGRGDRPLNSSATR